MSNDIDISKLTHEEIDKLSPDALRRALRSVIRSPGENVMHKNHNSHSNISDIASRGGNVIR
jgi:hypothetical protein